MGALGEVWGGAGWQAHDPPLRVGHDDGVVFAVGPVARAVRHPERPGSHGNLVRFGGTSLRYEPRVVAVEAVEHVTNLKTPSGMGGGYVNDEATHQSTVEP